LFISIFIIFLFFFVFFWVSDSTVQPAFESYGAAVAFKESTPRSHEHQYLEAIREAQARLIRDDKRVCILGQDVGGTFGGPCKSNKRSREGNFRGTRTERNDQRGCD